MVFEIDIKPFKYSYNAVTFSIMVIIIIITTLPRPWRGAIWDPFMSSMYDLYSIFAIANAVQCRIMIHRPGQSPNVLTPSLARSPSERYISTTCVVIPLAINNLTCQGLLPFDKKIQHVKRLNVAWYVLHHTYIHTLCTFPGHRDVLMDLYGGFLWGFPCCWCLFALFFVLLFFFFFFFFFFGGGGIIIFILFYFCGG